MQGIFNVAGYAAFLACAVLVMVAVPFAAFGAVPLAILLFFTFAGAQARALKAETLVQSTLMKGEQLVAQTLQHRAYALWMRREVLAITNSRILIIRRGLLGGVAADIGCAEADLGALGGQVVDEGDGVLRELQPLRDLAYRVRLATPADPRLDEVLG